MLGRRIMLSDGCGPFEVFEVLFHIKDASGRISTVDVKYCTPYIEQTEDWAIRRENADLKKELVKERRRVAGLRGHIGKSK
jgi:hypothetical protein